MSNARFSILQARAVKDKAVSDAQFRTLAALGMYADEDGWCFPSLSTLGKDLHKSKQAVGRDTIHLRKLGYLEVKARFDEKTGARRSSLYRLKFDLPPLPVDPPSTNRVDGYSTNHVDAPSTPEVDVNDPVNDPSNVPTEDDEKEEIQARAETLRIFYESTVGPITSLIMDKLEKAAKDYPDPTWYHPAFEVMKEHAEHRSWSYVDSVLKNWKEHYFGWKPGDDKRPAKKQTAAALAAAGDTSKYDDPKWQEYLA